MDIITRNYNIHGINNYTQYMQHYTLKLVQFRHQCIILYSVL